MARDQEISEIQACEFLSKFDLIDPDGTATIASAVAGAHCRMLTLPAGRVVYCLTFAGPCAWIAAAAGFTSASVTAQGLQMIEAQARKMHATSIGFQTARLGLVRRAVSSGYLRHSKPGGFTLSKRFQSNECS